MSHKIALGFRNLLELHKKTQINELRIVAYQIQSDFSEALFCLTFFYDKFSHNIINY